MSNRNNVIVFVQDPESKTVLLQARREQPFHGLWNGISGRMLEGETPVDAAARKLAIECGLVVPPEMLTECGVIHTEAGDLYVVTGWANIYAASNLTKHHRVNAPMNSNWSREPVVPNLRWLIPLAFDANRTGPFEASTR